MTSSTTTTPLIIVIALTVVALSALAVVMKDLRDPDDQAPRYQPAAQTRHAPWRIAAGDR